MRKIFNVDVNIEYNLFPFFIDYKKCVDGVTYLGHQFPSHSFAELLNLPLLYSSASANCLKILEVEQIQQNTTFKDKTNAAF